MNTEEQLVNVNDLSNTDLEILYDAVLEHIEFLKNSVLEEEGEVSNG